MSLADQITHLADQHQQRAEKLRTIQSLLADDPILVQELLVILTPPPPIKQPKKSKMEILLSYLRTRPSDWQTAREIAEGAGLPRNTVNFLLFSSNQKELFESEMRGPKKKVWRIKMAVVEDEPKPGTDSKIIHMKPKPKKESPKMTA